MSNMASKEKLLSLGEVAVALVGQKEWDRLQEWIEDGEYSGDGRYARVIGLSRRVSVRRGLLTIIDKRLHQIGEEFPEQRKQQESIQDPAFVAGRSELLLYRQSLIPQQADQRNTIRGVLKAEVERKRDKRLRCI